MLEIFGTAKRPVGSFVKVKISALNSAQLNIIRGGDDNGLKPKSGAFKVCNSAQC